MSAAAMTFPTLSVNLKVATCLGIGTSFILSGIQFLSSYMIIPSLLHPFRRTNQASPITSFPTRTIAQQFVVIYNRGVKAVVPLALFALANMLYVANAYRLHETNSHTGRFIADEGASLGLGWPIWALAGILTVSFLPFTFFTMFKINKALFELAKEGEDPTEKSVSGEATTTAAESVQLRTLLQQWVNLNFVRSGLSFLGGVVGLLALFASKSM